MEKLSAQIRLEPSFLLNFLLIAISLLIIYMTTRKKQAGKLEGLINELRDIQFDFLNKFGVADIISNSKIFEVVIANDLGHDLIPGHSGSRDAKNERGGEYEYKHYKESSSNHTWTFNDYTDSTISKLRNIEAVVFTHLDDSDILPKLNWYYLVPGHSVADYLEEKTQGIRNTRKMINVGHGQIERNLNIQRTVNRDTNREGKYFKWLEKICDIAKKIEEETGTKGVLTSNKFWEILVSLKLGHKVLSEQAGHDAQDEKGGYYEYKVPTAHSWNFQDISQNVLDKYKLDKKIILAVVDKSNFKVIEIYEADPLKTIKILKRKLVEKKRRFRKRGKVLRRLQISLSMGDIKRIKANLIYKD